MNEKNFKRGHDQTSDCDFRNRLIKSCQCIVAQKDDKKVPTIKIDYDAISILITCNGILQAQTKRLLLTFLLGFGSFDSAISVPHRGVLCHGDSSIFGCSRNKCQHLPREIESSEVIVIDTPIKIAVHISRKERIIDFLRKGGFPVFSAPNHDICFDPKKTINLPCYGLVINAIINSCINQGKNFIHVANVGMRIPIKAVIEPSDLSNPENSIDRLFSNIKQLRLNHETTVEILQLDLAFTSPHPKGEFLSIDASKNVNDQNTNSTILSKSDLVVYPMYTPTYDASPNGRKRRKTGTVIIKTKNRSSKSSATTILVGSECVDNYHPDRYFIFKKMTASDTTETETKENVEMNISNLYSLKFYSDHFHCLMQIYGSLPKKQSDMHFLPDRTIRQLTSALDTVWNTFKNTVDWTKSVGVGLRSEVSIRPVIEEDESSLRLTGHLNDFLMIAYFSLLDAYRGAYSVGKQTVNIEHTTTRLNTLIHRLRPYLRLRASRIFNQAYPHASHSLWLQAQMGQIMNLAGFAQLFYYDYVIKWLKSATFFDPHGDRKCHITPKPAADNIMELCLETASETNENELNSLLTKLISFLTEHNVSREDSDHIVTYVSTSSNAEGSLSCFTKLSYQGKLQILALSDDIIPLMANSESRNDTMDEVAKSGQRNDIGEVEGEYNDHDMECEEDFQNMFSEYPPTTEYELLLLQPNSTKHTTMNPYTQIIHSIDQLNKHIFFGSPAFNQYLFSFIIECHKENWSLPCQNTQTTNQKQLPVIGSGCMNILTQESPISLQQLKEICQCLSVPIIGINLKTEVLIKALSTHYLFPCSGVAYNKTDLQSNCSYFKHANLFLNKIMNRDVVITINGPKPITHHTIHKPMENKTISILRKKFLVTSAPTNYRREYNNDSKRGYKSLASYLNLPSSKPIRQMISTYLKDNICLDKSFILDNGLKNPSFEGTTNLEEIEMKHSILIGWPMVASPDHVEQYYMFAPDVIFPLISFLYEMDITFYDLPKEKTMMYTFSPSKKSVLYTFDSLDWSPTIDTTIVIYYGDSRYSFPKTTKHTQRKKTSRSLSHQHLNSNNSPNKMPSMRRLKDHAWKRSGIRTESLTKSLVEAMENIEYKWSDHAKQEISDNDPFNFEAFLNEFSHTDEDWEHLMKTLYCHDQTQYVKQSLLPKEHFINNVKSRDEQNNHAMLCPIFSLKFKISVTIWNSNKPVTTHHYSYCNIKSAIRYDTCGGYQHHHVHIWGQLLYIHIGTSRNLSKKYGYFITPCTNSISEIHPPILYNDSSSGQEQTPHRSRVVYNHIRKLNLAYSPSNTYFRDLVYSSFRNELRMQLHELDELQSNGSKTFDLHMKHIVSMNNILDNKMNDLSCLISFPRACDKSKCIPVTISCDNEDCRKGAIESSTEALNILSGPNDRIEMYEDIVHLTYPKMPLLGGFIFLLHMFLAQESNSPDQFEESIERLHREKDILEKVKLWTTQYLYDANVNPMWLNNILSTVNRKHGIWKDDQDNNETSLSWH